MNDANFNAKNLVPWVVFALTVGGAAVGIGYKLFFGATEGALLQQKVKTHVESSDKKFEKQDETDEKILGEMRKISDSVLKIQVKSRAGNWREVKEKLKEKEDLLERVDP